MTPLRSEFARDKDMAELLEYFTSELQSRIDDLSAAFSSNDHPQLRRLAHQMKGAAGGYGYPTISESAGELERMIDGGEDDASSLEAQFNRLVHLCRCAQAGAR